MNKDERVEKLISEIEKVIVGKREVIELVVAALLARGHVLVEDVPGVGKTQMVSAMAAACNGEFHRVQMTPDIMPGDITGFSMVRQDSGDMIFKKGAAFCNFFLADEINRSSPKSQSALLEIMEERQVSMDGVTYELPQPFMVMATQNPVETYGTYHLPEAQMDRFLMKLSMGYPTREEEKYILRHNGSSARLNLKTANAGTHVDNTIKTTDIIDLQEKADNIYVSPAIEEYIIRIVTASRQMDGIRLGASPRGSIALYQAAKAYAVVLGEDCVLPEMIKKIAPYVLAHRLMLSSQKVREWDTAEAAVEWILNTVEVPV
ncbi:MAG: MoxR family ATPase [Lachnospiraceae bacterium]|nr:MoxR family ATPase [Lachnospiraceae bacterium]